MFSKEWGNGKQIFENIPKILNITKIVSILFSGYKSLVHKKVCFIWKEGLGKDL